MDINLPGISGIEACKQITAAHPEVVVMLLSTYQAGDLPMDADECGATDVRAQGAVRPRVAPGDLGTTRLNGHLLAERDPPGDPGALAGCGLHVDGTADRTHAVAHVHEPVALVRAGSMSKPAPSSATSNTSAPSSSRTVIIACAPSPACLAAFWSASRQQK